MGFQGLMAIQENIPNESFCDYSAFRLYNVTIRLLGHVKGAGNEDNWFLYSLVIFQASRAESIKAVSGELKWHSK